MWLGIGGRRNFGELLHLLAAKVATNIGKGVQQYDVFGQFASADRDLTRAAFAGWFDVVVQGAKPDTICITDEVIIPLRWLNGVVVFIDFNKARVMQLGGSVPFLRWPQRVDATL